MCGWFLNATSTDPTMMPGYLEDEHGLPRETLLMRTLPLTTIYDFHPLYGNGSIKFKEYRNSIADVLVVSAANGSVTAVREGVRPVALECVLTWCVKSIRSSYASGRYREEILHVYHNITQGSHPWHSTPFETEYQSGTDVVYLSDISIDLGVTADGRNITGYGTTNNSASYIAAGFQEIFPAFYTTNGNNTRPMMRWKTWQTGPPWSRALDFNPWLAPNNVTRHMERLATAMTNVVRSAPSRTMLSGDAFVNETFIAISWEWLTFPFTLLVLSLVFLIATMIKTSRDGEIGAWKTSAMPALIYSLPQDVRKDLVSSNSDEVESKMEARKVRIRLLPDQGWRVSGQLRPSPLVDQRKGSDNSAIWI
jgi:hypothetical protein